MAVLVVAGPGFSGRATIDAKRSLALGAGLLVVASGAAAAPPTLVGPTPYLSEADIPADFYEGGTPVFLEDMEDGSLDGGLAASNGGIQGPNAITDSVDGDDGAIDGSGSGGHSFFTSAGVSGITFDLPDDIPGAPTAAALVYTDGGSAGTPTVVFEAFGPDGSLGTLSATPGSGIGGGTAEDRFLGVQNADGITQLVITSDGGLEVDHVQYGFAPEAVSVPVSSQPVLFRTAIGLVLALLGGLGAWRRRCTGARA